MIRPGELVYRLVVAVDIESYSKLNTLGQYEVQADLGDLLDKAATRAELDRETWDREIRGDGELSVLPADTDVAWVVARLTWELERALSERKAHRVRRPPLRLRVAMHYGTLTQGRFGPVGHRPADAGQVISKIDVCHRLFILLVVAEIHIPLPCVAQTLRIRPGRLVSSLQVRLHTC